MPNGCGPKGGWIRPPYAIFFKTSCDRHDEYYEKGGDAFDRWIADVYLLKYMWGDCNRLVWWKRPYYYLWCFLYYAAVRMGGWRYFEYETH